MPKVITLPSRSYDLVTEETSQIACTIVDQAINEMYKYSIRPENITIFVITPNIYWEGFSVIIYPKFIRDRFIFRLSTAQ